MLKNKNIFVTQPSLAPLNEFSDILKEVWDNGILTHHGPKVQELENLLSLKLNVKYLTSVVNGTLALHLAIKALNLEGEIITTPFTFIATASSIVWEKCTPIFVDINPDTFNIDSHKIKDAITSRTVAILAVHVFSNPCEIEAIDLIAKQYNLKIIYDAAHAMFVNYNGRSILEYGDISTTSFHATKIFNTGEGGACITRNKKLSERLKELRFFGYSINKDILSEGTNAKMTEIHAALGLANLKHIDYVLIKRKELSNLYKELLGNVVEYQEFNSNSYNYTYMPVLFKNSELLINIEKRLNEKGVFPRRYFNPSLNELPDLENKQSCPISEDISRRVLCLPLYTELKREDIKEICNIIKKSCK